MPDYQFHPKKISTSGESKGTFKLSTNKVVCVGRNYANHASELNNTVPKTPLLFIKPSNTLVDLCGELEIPVGQGECQHELEIALLIKSPLTKATEQECLEAIGGIGLALDLTLRDLQGSLKSKGHPWEKAKAFDGACPVSGFIEVDTLNKPGYSNLDFQLQVNDRTVQKGNTKQMIFDIAFLLKEISQYFSLFPGDIVLTGTPEGVGALVNGDRLELQLNHEAIATASIKVNL